jgi:hypothetical protein
MTDCTAGVLWCVRGGLNFCGRFAWADSRGMMKQRDGLLVRGDNSQLRTYVVDVGGDLVQPLLICDFIADLQLGRLMIDRSDHGNERA